MRGSNIGLHICVDWSVDVCCDMALLMLLQVSNQRAENAAGSSYYLSYATFERPGWINWACKLHAASTFVASTINFNFLHLCSKIKQKIAWMNKVKMSWYEKKMRWKAEPGQLPEKVLRKIRKVECHLHRDD